MTRRMLLVAVLAAAAVTGTAQPLSRAQEPAASPPAAADGAAEGVLLRTGPPLSERLRQRSLDLERALAAAALAWLGHQLLTAGAIAVFSAPRR